MIKKINSYFDIKYYSSIIIFGFIIIFTLSKDYQGTLIDSLTYSALAKNILATGDWKTLHYSLFSYADFYQHPPLAIWMQAIVFKLLGTSEWISRLLPAFLAFGTFILTILTASKLFNKWTGFVAGLILITSTRFVKWGTIFYLDGPMAFWMMLTIYLFVLLTETKNQTYKKTLLSFFIGLTMFSAFLTKGLVFLSLPFSMLFFFMYSILKRNFNFSSLCSLIVVPFLAFSLFFTLWFYHFSGSIFLSNYLSSSVGNRLTPNSIYDFFYPVILISKTYIPWVFFLFYGVLASIRSVIKNSFSNEHIVLFIFLSTLGGFMATGHFMEHYSVVLMPFMAILASIKISDWLKKFEHKIKFFLFYGSFVLALFLATIVPPKLINYMPLSTIHSIAEILNGLPYSKKHQIKTIIITDDIKGDWYTYAVMLWKTDWRGIKVIKTNAIPIKLEDGELLITKTQPIQSFDKLCCLNLPGITFSAWNHNNLCQENMNHYPNVP